MKIKCLLSFFSLGFLILIIIISLLRVFTAMNPIGDQERSGFAAASAGSGRTMNVLEYHRR